MVTISSRYITCNNKTCESAAYRSSQFLKLAADDSEKQLVQYQVLYSMILDEKPWLHRMLIHELLFRFAAGHEDHARAFEAKALPPAAPSPTPVAPPTPVERFTRTSRALTITPSTARFTDPTEPTE